MLAIFLAAIVAACVTAFTTPVIRKWAEQTGTLDKPDERRINTVAIPRLGGIAIFLGFVVAVVLSISLRHFAKAGQSTWTPHIVGILLATTFAAVLGFVDDKKNLSPKWQILAIVGSALILCFFNVRIDGITNPIMAMNNGQYDLNTHWFAFSKVISVIATIFWVFVVTKTVDAIDGLDGLASGVCAISATALALMAVQLNKPEFSNLAVVSAAIAGACIGFLRHNYHPAKIFMGTVGAWGLGVPLASVSILGAFKVAAAVSVLVPILVLGVPIFDFTHVLARRVLEKAPLTAADKRHLHHRLLAKGWSQQQVAWTIYGIAFAFCALAFALFQINRSQVNPPKNTPTTINKKL